MAESSKPDEGQPVPQLLTGKVVLVVGASRGIGAGIARAVFAAGGSLVLGARALDQLEALARELDPAGARTLPLALDMADGASLDRAVAAAVARFGRLDAAINNGGISIGRSPLAETADADFERAIAINLTGVFKAMKPQLRAMLAGGRGGSIINISSSVALSASPFIGAYVASKAGVNGLTRSAAMEYAPHGIRINAIAPGAVMTDLLRQGPASSPEALQLMIGKTPMARLGDAGEIAAAAVWLASDQSSYVTGAILPVDGGLAC